MMVKSASPTTVAAVGDVVTYTFHVTNTGNVTVSAVAIDETAFSGTGTPPVASCPPGPLAPTQSADCTATYTVTQADLDAGSITNTATATATPPAGAAAPVSPPSTATVPATQSPALTMVKSASPTSVAAAGDVVTYTFHVTNTGNVTVSTIAIDETAFSGAAPPTATCPLDALAPGDGEDCTATYTVTQADIDAGSITNTAIATGTITSGGTAESPPSTATVPATRTPGLTMVKSADPTTVDAAGAVITYTFHVTNTGDVTVSGVAIDETVFSGSGPAPSATCPSDSLAPGDSEDCTATYTVTQADMDAGSIANTAVASGTSPGGGSAQSPPSSASASATQTATLTMVKTADPSVVTAAGQLVTYSFVVTNTGNVTLTDVTVTDPMPGLSAVTCPSTTLAPATSMTCTATYTTTPADVAAGASRTSRPSLAVGPNGDAAAHRGGDNDRSRRARCPPEPDHTCGSAGDRLIGRRRS